MGPIVLQHPEAAREVAVFPDAGVDLRFEDSFVSRPWHQFVIDRVAQVEHPRLPGRNTLKHGIVVHILYEERAKASQTSDKETGPANTTHLPPQLTFPPAAFPAPNHPTQTP